MRVCVCCGSLVSRPLAVGESQSHTLSNLHAEAFLYFLQRHPLSPQRLLVRAVKLLPGLRANNEILFNFSKGFDGFFLGSFWPSMNSC
jgi:hypothetical protein